MRLYEIVYIFDADLDEAAVEPKLESFHALAIAGGGEITAVSRAPPGATPGVVMAEQIQLRAVVTAVDVETRRVTLDVPSGGERVLKVGGGIDLERVKIGEQVSLTLTRALAISIEKR